jgi:hypothetical protein
MQSPRHRANMILLHQRIAASATEVKETVARVVHETVH